MATEAKAAEAAPPEEKPVDEVEEVNPLELADEDFLKINAPPPKKEKEGGEEDPKLDKQEIKSGDLDESTGPEKTDKPEAKAEVSPPGSKTTEEKPKTEAKEEKKAEAADPDAPVDYEGFFKQIMTPFKANGKTIEVKTPDEAIRLMQMGAGYGRKIQDMQPHLKVLRMLEKNNLLDEGKLSYLIDLNLKKPEAIKKLIKDGGIDPLDLNPDDKVTYTPTNHGVSDKEVVFHQAIKEVQQLPGGHETLQHINQTWDQESKQLLWDEPEIFGVIQSQRENGVYDQILTEIDRQKFLGHIKQNTPFLQAYKVAGDHLVQTNGFKAPIQNQPGNGTTPPPQVIATRTATPKSEAQNSERAAAALSTKAVSATKPAITVNPLEMADDDFMQQFKGRF